MTEQIDVRNETEIQVSGPGQQPLLEVKSLKKYFPVQKGWLRRVVGQVRAVEAYEDEEERSRIRLLWA